VGSPLGEALDGEVEDWMITIGKNPYTNPSNKYDVTGDGFVSPIDVLQIVNYINAGFPSRPPLPPTAVPPYLDVNGDGFINALDVLSVIDFINSNINGGTGGEGEGSSFRGVANVGDSWISAQSSNATSSAAVPMVFDRPDVRLAVSSGTAAGVQSGFGSTDRTFASMFDDASDLPADVLDFTVASVGSTEDDTDSELVSILGDVLDDLL
jgi:hypothetical protein